MTRSKTAALVVGDLFCGAGGFAEGFRQAGFEIAWGVDHWKPAVTSFRHNFPGAEAIERDVFALRPGSMTKVDVLIGSPPCIHFSPANRGGGGDVQLGMSLVDRFVDFVSELNPRYWVMENVPALKKHLVRRIRDRSYTGTSTVDISNVEVLDASKFGTPQSRRRLFSGTFPLPSPQETTESRGLTLRRIVNALPDPANQPPKATTRLADPLYPSLRIRADRLRDHFEDPRWRISESDVESTRERRVHDRIYGVMPFPDRLDSPARTITATRTRGSRGSVVVPWDRNERPSYRTMTLRECAIAQGFPLSFQFWGDSLSAKDALVGNAVPPPLARAIAVEILKDAGRPVPRRWRLVAPRELAPKVAYRSTGPRKWGITRHFRAGVPIDWRRDHRVELDNETGGGTTESLGRPSAISWHTRLYLGYATRYRCYGVEVAAAVRLARAIARTDPSGQLERKIRSLLLTVSGSAIDRLPSANAVQEVWAGWRQKGLSPYGLVDFVAQQVADALPSTDWRETIISARDTGGILEKAVVRRGSDAEDGQPIDASFRLLAATAALSIVCEKLNHGGTRLEQLRAGLASGRGLFSRRLDGI